MSNTAAPPGPSVPQENAKKEFVQVLMLQVNESLYQKKEITEEMYKKGKEYILRA